MIKIGYAITIRKPVDDVFRFIATDYLENHSKWLTGYAPVSRTSEGPIQAGSAGRVISKDIHGRLVERTLTVTEYIPNARFSYKSTLAFVTQEGTVVKKGAYTKTLATMIFEAVKGGTRVQLSGQAWFHLSGIYSKLMLLFMYGYYSRNFQRGSVQNMNNMATLLDGPSKARELKALALRAWSWWLFYFLLFVGLLLLYSARENMQLPELWTQVLQAILIAMGVLSVMALYIYIIVQKSVAKR